MKPNLIKNRMETEKRRAVQPLWNALDRFVGPYLHAGVCLCVSGGPDSRALLEAVARWKMRSRGRIMVVVVDHCARQQAADEADAVAGRALALGFEWEKLRLYPAVKLDEATLRARRYKAIFQAAKRKGLAHICTAHHQDDDAEGFLMDLLGLGGGHQGSAMRSVAKFGEFSILRPFLQLAKAELRLALSALDVTDYFEDPHDSQCQNMRAVVRNRLIPVLQKHHSNMSERLALLARRSLEQSELVQSQADEMEITNVGSKSIFIRSKESNSPAAVRSCLMRAARELSGGDDVRSASSTIDRIIAKTKCNKSTDEGLDQIIESFTLQRSKPYTFDLPGLYAHVTSDGILLEKR